MSTRRSRAIVDQPPLEEDLAADKSRRPSPTSRQAWPSRRAPTFEPITEAEIRAIADETDETGHGLPPLPTRMRRG
jgi:hypothetical protein